ncbi:MAG: hypothetical protein CBD21_05290 [bacterium TMED161]|nr:MAG: hypothetical protein CBD21_05290 [bacterium TMED161]
MRIKIGDKKIFSDSIKMLLDVDINIERLNAITFDSRNVEKGDVFIALLGENSDGHNFIQECVDRGASLIINEKIKADNIVEVKSSKKILIKLASLYRSQMSCRVIGITGSNGKTTTKELLAHVLNGSYRISFTKGNYNSTIGMPMSLFAIKKSDEIFIAEIGTNKKGEIEYLSDIAKPDMALITNISESHLSNLKDLNGVFEEKINLFKALSHEGIAFINMDDKFLSILKKETQYNHITFGFNGDYDFNATIKEDSNSLVINGYKVIIPNSSNLHLYNILSAFSICTTLGVEIKDFNQKLNLFEMPSGRGDLIHINEFIIVNDSYNANYGSVISGLRKLSGMYANHRKLVVIGDMLELGEDEKKIHKNLYEHINHNKFYRTYLYGSLMHELFLEAKRQKTENDIRYYENQEELINELQTTLKPKDILYIKGSRGMKMENIIKGVA